MASRLLLRRYSSSDRNLPHGCLHILSITRVFTTEVPGKGIFRLLASPWASVLGQAYGHTTSGNWPKPEWSIASKARHRIQSKRQIFAQNMNEWPIWHGRGKTESNWPLTQILAFRWTSIYTGTMVKVSVGMVYKPLLGINTGSKEHTSLVWAEVITALLY